jgi:hypothetical protein
VVGHVDPPGFGRIRRSGTAPGQPATGRHRTAATVHPKSPPDQPGRPKWKIGGVPAPPIFRAGRTLAVAVAERSRSRGWVKPHRGGPIANPAIRAPDTDDQPTTGRPRAPDTQTTGPRPAARAPPDTSDRPATGDPRATDTDDRPATGRPRAPDTRATGPRPAARAPPDTQATGPRPATRAPPTQTTSPRPAARAPPTHGRPARDRPPARPRHTGARPATGRPRAPHTQATSPRPAARAPPTHGRPARDRPPARQ